MSILPFIAKKQTGNRLVHSDTTVGGKPNSRQGRQETVNDTKQTNQTEFGMVLLDASGEIIYSNAEEDGVVTYLNRAVGESAHAFLSATEADAEWACYALQYGKQNYHCRVMKASSPVRGLADTTVVVFEPTGSNICS